MSSMNQIYQRVANDTGHSPETVKKVVEHMFTWLRAQLSEITSDKIMVTGLGTFKLLESKMRKALKAKNLTKQDRELTEQLLNKYFN